MSSWRTLCDTVYWLALTIWVAAIMSAGVAATGTFTTLPDLGVTLSRYAQYDDARHGRLAAGHVMEPIFTFVDGVQFVAGAGVLLTVALQWLVFKLSLRRVLNIVRVAGLVLAAGVFAYRGGVLTPGMNRDLRAYWQAAEAGDVETAEAHRAAFDAVHPCASGLYSATLGLLIIGVLASPAALRAPTPAPPSPGLETPKLTENMPR